MQQDSDPWPPGIRILADQNLFVAFLQSIVERFARLHVDTNFVQIHQMIFLQNFVVVTLKTCLRNNMAKIVIRDYITVARFAIPLKSKASFSSSHSEIE